MKWFRFYHAAYRNPKVQDMRPELFRFWVNLLCVASESEPRGTIASEAHLRLALGLTKASVKRWVSELEASVLLHRSSTGTLHPHDWDDLQPEGDDEGKRKKRQRQAKLRHTDNGDSIENVPGHVPGHVPASRARALLEGEGEGEGEENPPLPPAISLGPEYTQLGEFAIQLMGDVSWGRWVSQQGMMGHSASDIRACLEECAGAGKNSQAYAASKLRGWATEGGRPRRKAETNGRTAVQQRREETAIPLKPRYIPEGPEGDVFRKMWGITEEAS